MNNETERPEPDDELLAIRCQLGERDAFDELVARFAAPLRGYLNRTAGDAAGADDLVQDAWLRILRSLPSLRDPARLRSWIFGIAHRVLIDRLRERYAARTESAADRRRIPMKHEFDDDQLAAELRRLNEQALSTRERMFHVLLLLAATAVTVILAALLLTEPALPARTTLAFWVMTGMGLAWVFYASWVLARRRTLQLRHRVRAGQMAVAFTTIFAATAWIVAWATEDKTAYLAAGVGTLLWSAAWFPLGRARRRVNELEQRKRELQQHLRRG